MKTSELFLLEQLLEKEISNNPNSYDIEQLRTIKEKISKQRRKQWNKRK